MSKTKQIIQAVKKLLYEHLKKYTVYTVQAAGKKDGFTSVSSRTPLPRYNRLYLGNNGASKTRKRIKLNKSRFVKRSLSDLGLVIMPGGLQQSNDEDVLIVPSFINLAIKLPADLDTYVKGLPNTARYDIRRIKKGGFTSVISADVGWVNTYYEDYYKPSMQGRHGDEAYIMPKAKMHSLVKSGKAEFVKIYSGDCCVAAVLAKDEKQRYHFFKIGWLNGDPDHIKTGAVAAMYWYAVQRAFELKCRELVLGGTPAYLESGVFKYKAKWGATCSASGLFGINNLMLNPDNANCYRFLKDVSLIALSKQNKLIVLTGKSRDEINLTGPILNDFAGWYVLRNTKACTYTNEVDELPMALRSWYDKLV